MQVLDMVQLDMVQLDMVQLDVVQLDMVQLDMVQLDMVQLDMVQLRDKPHWSMKCAQVLCYSNKLINKMQHFNTFITWRLCVAQHVLSASSPIIRSLQLY